MGKPKRPFGWVMFRPRGNTSRHAQEHEPSDGLGLGPLDSTRSSSSPVSLDGLSERHFHSLPFQALIIPRDDIHNCRRQES